MRLSFYGAAKMVTGSSYLMEVNGFRFLIDCGMFQGPKHIKAMNFRHFPYDPASIDFVLLTHAHIDHSGLLPKLWKQGFKGKIYATSATCELCGIMLPDSAHIQEFDASIMNRKGVRAGRAKVEPLYTVDDANSTLAHLVPVPYDTKLSINEHIVARYQDAGHMLGSSILEIWIKEEGEEEVKFVFSGDLGQENQPIICNPTYIDETDFLIVESTYGTRTREEFAGADKLAEIINLTFGRGGNVIIPAFAVGRTQTVLYYLHKLLKAGKIKDIPVILDSPLAIAATDVFLHHPEVYDKETIEMFYQKQENPIELPKLRFSNTAEESRLINQMDESAVIISASGMADAGRILHHLKHNLWRENSSIIFVGYQAQGSLGRRLIDGAPQVRILGEDIKIKANIYNLEGFSAHADREQLKNWIANFKGQLSNIFVVHGEADVAEQFSQDLSKDFNISTIAPEYGDFVTIKGHEWDFEKSGIIIVETVAKQLQDMFSLVEVEFNNYKQKLEQVLALDAKRLPDVIRKLEKLRNVMRKTVNKMKF